ncbi:ferredoxin FdxA [Xenophilus azovorans]|uniref:ferredoxin FdxA n=1 Tax=Xenophilus azovorans TaxID=151755 RepID=UPI00056E50D5|nr:ferredoxin FdxA [Xenophilus azovorans]
MSYVVTEACIRCKYTDCVAICPVDAFREGPAMLVIDPEVCIDCGVCEPECPAQAIAFDLQAGPRWREINRRFAAEWPAITAARPAPPDAEAHRGLPGKLERFFPEGAAA